MDSYRIWADGAVVKIDLNDEPRAGDLIDDGDSTYTVTGRRFVGGLVHWAASKQASKSIYETQGFKSL